MKNELKGNKTTQKLVITSSSLLKRGSTKKLQINFYNLNSFPKNLFWTAQHKQCNCKEDSEWDGMGCFLGCSTFLGFSKKAAVKDAQGLRE